MGRIVNWIAKRLVGALGQELEALKATQDAYHDQQAGDLARIEARLSEVSAGLSEVSANVREVSLNSSEVSSNLSQVSSNLSEATANLSGASSNSSEVSSNLSQVSSNLSEASANLSEEFVVLREVSANLSEVSAISSAVSVALTEVSAVIKEIPDTARAELDKRLLEQEQRLSERIDTAVSIAESTQREEIGRQVRAELAPVSKLATQHFTWSKDTARMVGELRAEMRLLTQAPNLPAAVESGDSDDPQLLRRYVEKSNIRELYPTELFEGMGELSLPIASINEESGHGNQVDLMYVAAIAKVRGARSIFEFGTYIGRTTYHLTFASEDARVVTLNLPPTEDDTIKESLGRMFRGTDREERITQLLGDSATFDPAPYAESMDFVFVDADHSYELVKNDTEKALAMLKPGGVIVWHDYAVKSPGVVRYIHEFAGERPVFRLKHTCLIVYLDGVDAMTFQPSQRASRADPPSVSSPGRDDDVKQKMEA